MGIKKYFSNADSTITNAYKSNLTSRATGSNMGASDILEVYSIYGQATTSSREESRILISFPTSGISSDRAAGSLPASGSVNFYLKLYDAEHGQSLPNDYYLNVKAVSSSWEEGYGLDMETFKDLGVVNWESRSVGNAWSAAGGDYHASPSYSQFFTTGEEDLSIDVTDLVEQWLSGSKANSGFGVYLSSSHTTANRSYYTKKFFGKGTEFFFQRPTLEARWNSALTDDRDNFYASSSLVPADDNLNKIYLYNRYKGRLVDIPSIGTGSIYVGLHSGSSTAVTGAALSSFTGSWVSTGIYSASVYINTTASYLYDVWHDNSGNEFLTGSRITVRSHKPNSNVFTDEYVCNITNLKPTYSNQETARFRLFVRNKDWNPTIYTVSTKNIQSDIIDNAYYGVSRYVDDLEVIPYGTGSLQHTKLSYDKEGNYFDLDMSMLEAGYSYKINFVFKINDRYEEQSEYFKFRVE